MTHYILFSEDGAIVARFASAIHGDNIPSEAISVSEDVFWRTVNETDGIWKRNRETGEIKKHPLPDPVPYIPHQVSRAQGKAALITAGLWPDVLAYVDAITDPTEKALAEVALNDTTHWRRDSPTMQAISTALGITGEQMDDLFIQASQINL